MRQSCLRSDTLFSRKEAGDGCRPHSRHPLIGDLLVRISQCVATVVFGLSTTSASGAAAALRLPSQVSGAIPFSSILSRCLSILGFSAFALL